MRMVGGRGDGCLPQAVGIRPGVTLDGYGYELALGERTLAGTTLRWQPSGISSNTADGQVLEDGLDHHVGGRDATAGSS